MYKIRVIDNATKEIFFEYGFSKYITKRIHFFLNERYDDGYPIYEILDLSKIVCTFKTFYKCLTHYVETRKGTKIMKINGTNYFWNKTYTPDKGTYGCFYEIGYSDNYDSSKRGSLTYVTNIFSAAVAVLEDLKAYTIVEDSILENIITSFKNSGEYINPENNKYTYYIKPINIWKVERISK